MSLLSKPGRYLAYPESWGIKHEEGKCPRFAMVFRCTQTTAGEAVEGDQRITGFFTLLNRDNSPNEINLNALHDALGWDGQNFASLDAGDWSKAQVQLVVEQGEYMGEKRLEVKYLNPADYSGGGIDKADPQAVQSLDAKYGSMLRAVFKKNGAVGNGNGGGAKTATLTRPAPVPVGADPVADAKQASWVAFVGKTPEYDSAKRTTVFKRLVTEIHPTKQPRELTADDWLEVTKRVEEDFSAATEALVPF